MPRLSLEGGYPLKGDVSISGAKNAALPIMAATILLDGHTVLNNVPLLKDVNSMIRMLNALDLRAEFSPENRIKLWNTKKVRHNAPYDLVNAMRASFFVAGPILAKTGYAKIPLPGGCSIGARPVDLHLKGFEALGATVRIEHGFCEIQAKKLVGDRFYLDFPSVGATENIMMAASLAEGQTIIENAAQEPEITDLGEFLIAAGARISGLNTSTIIVDGVPSLRGVEYDVMPDRIEAATLMIAAAITQGDVWVNDIVPNHLEALIRKLNRAGVQMDIEPNRIRVKPSGPLQAVDFETQPFPGFPTDMQAQMMTLLTVSQGSSVVKETIFENRFMHAGELCRMGADIRVEGRTAFIKGVEKLTGAEVKITDLRAGAALILAGLAAEGKTTVYGLKHLQRGYDNLPSKLEALGAKIMV